MGDEGQENGTKRYRREADSNDQRGAAPVRERSTDGEIIATIACGTTTEAATTRLLRAPML